MGSRYDDLDRRTKAFAIQAIRFAKQLHQIPVVGWLARQLVNAATSVAANQRAARRSRSDKEVFAKLSIVVEEADESVFWCELFADLELPASLRQPLAKLTAEAEELRNIYATGRATVRRRLELADNGGV
jgi:four helix bundle protein